MKGGKNRLGIEEAIKGGKNRLGIVDDIDARAKEVVRRSDNCKSTSKFIEYVDKGIGLREWEEC